MSIKCLNSGRKFARSGPKMCSRLNFWPAAKEQKVKRVDTSTYTSLFLTFSGHTDANFNIAILDGHKEFVAHEKFQQMLHKKWGQRDRLQWKDTPSYNIFWSEMKGPGKLFHIIKQFFIFLILPLVVLASTLGKCFESCFPCSYLIRQSQIPVNRFLYWEMSKWVFYVIVMATLVDDEDVTWYDMVTVFWIVSYLLENVRTIHR